MPLRWTILPHQRLFVATADGFVDLAEVNQMLDAMAAGDVHGYRKMFDGSRGDTRMSPAELLSLGVRMRSIHATRPMGPLAIVIPDNKYYLIARVLGMLAAAKRPMRVFKEPGKARQWLDSSAIRASMPEPMAGDPSNGPLPDATPAKSSPAAPEGSGLV